MNSPTHLCVNCGSDKLQLDFDIPASTITCQKCGKKTTTYNSPPSEQEMFIALNQRISTLQDALLDQQETIQKLLDGLEKYTQITRAIVHHLELDQHLRFKP